MISNVVRAIKITVLRSRYEDPSSNPGRGGCLHFTSSYLGKGKNPVMPLPAMNKK